MRFLSVFAGIGGFDLGLERDPVARQEASGMTRSPPPPPHSRP